MIKDMFPVVNERVFVYFKTNGEKYGHESEYSKRTVQVRKELALNDTVYFAN